MDKSNGYWTACNYRMASRKRGYGTSALTVNCSRWLAGTSRGQQTELFLLTQMRQKL